MVLMVYKILLVLLQVGIYLQIHHHICIQIHPNVQLIHQYNTKPSSLESQVTMEELHPFLNQVDYVSIEIITNSQ